MSERATRSRAGGAAGSAGVPPGSRASSPRPKALRILASILSSILSSRLDRPGRRSGELAGQRAVRDGPARAWIVLEHREPVARAFGKADVAGDHGAKDLVAEVRAHLVLHLLREAVASVEHREHQAFE